MEMGDVEPHDQNIERSTDDVTIFINEKLQEITSTVLECCIYRVPKRLLNVNRTAYVPQVISIGPFHHNKDPNFQVTEKLKLRFLNSYLCRIDMSVQGVVEKARGWNREARQCYSEPILMNDDEFVRMMVLDGCILVEFMVVYYGNTFPQTQTFYETIAWDIVSDLTMLENQLPFFVPPALFDLLSSPTSSNNSFPCFEQVVHEFLGQFVFPNSNKYELPYDIPNNNENPQHLVDFLSYYFVPPASKHEYNYYCPPPTATELYEAGVILKKAKKKKVRNMVGIRFKDGVLKIPPFVIGDYFEIYERNLVAFEQLTVKNNNKYAIHYINFLDELICTEKDVSLLVKEGILTNNIGGIHTKISKVFNDICKKRRRR